MFKKKTKFETERMQVNPFLAIDNNLLKWKRPQTLWSWLYIGTKHIINNFSFSMVSNRRNKMLPTFSLVSQVFISIMQDELFVLHLAIQDSGSKIIYFLCGHCLEKKKTIFSIISYQHVYLRAYALVPEHFAWLSS